MLMFDNRFDRRTARSRRPASGPDMPSGNGAPEARYVYQGGQPHQPGPPEPFITGKCGTAAGWNEHQRNREPKCDACRQYHREYMQAWRLRTGRTKTIRVRPSAGLLKLLSVPDEAA